MAKGFPNVGATVIDSSSDLPTASAALEGVMMFQKDTNELKICDGSSWVSVVDTDTPPAMQLINPTSVVNGTNTGGTVTCSSQSSVSLNGVFSSAYENYKVIIQATAAPSLDGSVGMRLRSSGTDNTGSYYMSGAMGSWNVASISVYNGTTTYGLLGEIDKDTAGNWWNSSIDIYSPFSASNTVMATYNTSNISQANASSWNSGGWNRNVAGGFDGFTIANTAGGTISMKIRVYGYRNSI